MFEESPGRPWKLTAEQMSDGQKALIGRIESGPRGRVPPNLLIWLNNLPFADVVEKYGEYVTQLAPFVLRQKEIIILVVAAHFDSAFEWHFHAPMAKRQGVTDAQLEAIRAQRDPGFADAADQVTWQLVSSLLAAKGITDDLHARAMQLLGHKGVQDAIGLMGLYTMIAQTIAFYKVPTPN